MKLLKCAVYLAATGILEFFLGRIIYGFCPVYFPSDWVKGGAQ